MDPFIQINYGENRITKGFYPDLAINIIFFDSRCLSIKNSSIYTGERGYIFYDRYSFNARLVNDSLKEETSSLILDDIICYFSQGSTSNLPHLAFAYKVDERSSIVHQAYKKGLIDKLQFSIERNKETENKIVLGGIPSGYTNTPKAIINVLKGYKTWGCLLDSIQFLDWEYEVGEYAYFDYKYKHINLFP